MLLSQVREYMQLKQRATFDEMTVALNVEGKVLEQLIGYWQRKGKITEHEVKNCNSTCSSCHCKAYIWIESSQSSVKL